MTFHVACVPPTTTHQAKRIVRLGRFARLADKPELVAARKTLGVLLTPFRPKAPLRGPVVLGVVFEWPWDGTTGPGVRSTPNVFLAALNLACRTSRTGPGGQ